MPDDNLFRPEAEDSLKPRMEGEVLALNPVSARRIVQVGGALAIGALVFASVATYSTYVPASGVLAPEAGLMQVRARSAGTLRAVSTAVGEEVRQAAVLGVLDKHSALASGALAPELAAKLLLQRKALARLESDARVAALIAQAHGLAEKARALERALDASVAASGPARQALAVSREQLERNERLVASGSSSKAAQEDLQRVAIDREMAVRQLEQSQAQLRAELAAARAGAAEAQAQAASAKAAAQGSDALLDAERLTLDAAAQEAVTAPLAGRVVAAPARPGPVGAGELLFVIAPKGELMAHLVLPEAAAARARPGQKVALRLQGQSSRGPVQLRGTVRSIAEGAVSGEGPNAPGGFPSLVELEPLAVADQHEAHALLRPGARIDARIQVETHTLLGWLFEPLRRGLSQVGWGRAEVGGPSR